MNSATPSATSFAHPPTLSYKPGTLNHSYLHAKASQCPYSPTAIHADGTREAPHMRCTRPTNETHACHTRTTHVTHSTHVTHTTHIRHIHVTYMSHTRDTHTAHTWHTHGTLHGMGVLWEIILSIRQQSLLVKCGVPVDILRHRASGSISTLAFTKIIIT